MKIFVVCEEDNKQQVLDELHKQWFVLEYESRMLSKDNEKILGGDIDRDKIPDIEQIIGVKKIFPVRYYEPS